MSRRHEIERAVPTRRTLGLVAAFAVLASGCEPESPAGGACPYRPAYHLTVTAEDGELPAGTSIRFEFGGGRVEYPAAQAAPSSEQLFCSESGAGGRGSDQITCDAWITGPAIVRVTAPDHAAATEPVSMAWVDGCPDTLPIDVALEPEPSTGD